MSYGTLLGFINPARSDSRFHSTVHHHSIPTGELYQGGGFQKASSGRNQKQLMRSVCWKCVLSVLLKIIQHIICNDWGPNTLNLAVGMLSVSRHAGDEGDREDSSHPGTGRMEPLHKPKTAQNPPGPSSLLHLLSKGRSHQLCPISFAEEN